MKIHPILSFQGKLTVSPLQKDSHMPSGCSSAAYLLVAAALNPFPYVVSICDLDMHSPQGDKQIIEILTQMGVQVEVDPPNKVVTIHGGQSLKGTSLDCAQNSDLIPILLVTSLFADQETFFIKMAQIPQNETNRVSRIMRELRKMGAIITENTDMVSVQGPQQLKGAHFNHEDDPQVVMALTIAALFARSDSEMDHPEIVHDFYPTFFQDLVAIGANFTE